MQHWSNRINLEGLSRLAAPVFLVLMLWWCWRLASMMWWVIAPPKLPVVQSVSLGSQQPLMPDIVRFSLFEPPPTQTASPVVAYTPPTVAIKLDGVLLSGRGSSALLRVNDKADNYRIGQKLADSDYRLTKVYWNRVVVRDSQGQRRTVKFGDPPLPPPPPAGSVGSSTGAPANPDREGNGTDSNPNGTSNSGTNGINQAIQSLQSNRDQYLNQMGLTAGSNGLEITDRTPANLRAKIGLRAGDRIVSVNGMRLTGSGNEAQLLEQVKNSGQARIEIQRGDQTMTVQQTF